ncbi:hypothetical protein YASMINEVIRUS_102 [Yasminevirus sp. GU-2018]|uniref:Uncharacterized protein n=1 Tax=Yasminevirus sp. GU-2018 TaxID=2420051 RepID=A0A5K0U6R1_9VIRU|nr:hypothetical protein YASMINEVIRUS_102 [Yasminevirus sp. GU-2018]
MSFRDRSSIFVLMTGVAAGAILSSIFLGAYRTFFGLNKKKKALQYEKVTPTEDIIPVVVDQSNSQTNSSNLGSTFNTALNATLNATLSSTLSSSPRSLNTQHGRTDDLEPEHMTKPKKEALKIKEIDKSPLELRKRFDNKGYVFITQNLATVNTEINELVELMRKLDLHILNGCSDPLKCGCNFRHRNCRLFMIRKYSVSPELQFFAPSCKGVTNIAPSNSDIKNGTPIHEFVQLFQNKFSDRVMDLVNYINFIVAPEKRTPYVVDITMIADPYVRSDKSDEESHNTKYTQYGQPADQYDPLNPKDHDRRVVHDGKIVVDTSIDSRTGKNKENKCSLKWHQDRFVEANTNKTHAYDFVAMFVLKAQQITPHKLMIGKVKEDIDIAKSSTDEIQQNVNMLADAWIDSDHDSDIGYVIDQTQGYLHKHSDFDYQSSLSRRNVITIRIKYLDQ